MKYQKIISLVSAGAFLVAISGCNIDSIPLKSRYADHVTEFTTAKPVDSTWAVIEALFEGSGMGVKKLEKGKGRLVTKMVPAHPMYSHEDPNGQMESPEAWVIVERVLKNGKEWKAKEFFSTWNIQVDVAGAGSRVRIDPELTCTFYPNIFTSMEFPARSTGRMEDRLRQALMGDSVFQFANE